MERCLYPHSALTVTPSCRVASPPVPSNFVQQTLSAFPPLGEEGVCDADQALVSNLTDETLPTDRMNCGWVHMPSPHSWLETFPWCRESVCLIISPLLYSRSAGPDAPWRLQGARHPVRPGQGYQVHQRFDPRPLHQGQSLSSPHSSLRTSSCLEPLI